MDLAHVYILANRRRATLYIGVTSNLVRRVHEHREGLAKGFTKDYGVKQLVWFEGTPSIVAAIEREKQLKNWRRAWKIELVESVNPTWRDLYPALLGAEPLPRGFRRQGMDPGSGPG
ncbi:MAG: GIY-YIG nuclease family protein [Comamonadaceae bacterium]|nr:MAG: GIY-YIG nuclease family protein [Comamonadaceae bacterium]